VSLGSDWKWKANVIAKYHCEVVIARSVFRDEAIFLDVIPAKAGIQNKIVIPALD